jgi:hypothetical protein
VILFAALLSGLAMGPPPAWIQRAVPPPIVAWRTADVLGTPIVEGIAVDRDAAFGTLTVNVVDSRFDPPEIVRQRDLKGTKVRWLRAGRPLPDRDRDRRDRPEGRDRVPPPRAARLHPRARADDARAESRPAHLLRLARGFRGP